MDSFFADSLFLSHSLCNKVSTTLLRPILLLLGKKLWELQLLTQQTTGCVLRADHRGLVGELA